MGGNQFMRSPAFNKPITLFAFSYVCMSTFYGRGLYGRMYVCSGELCMCGLADVGEHTSGHDHNPGLLAVLHGCVAVVV